MLYRKYAQEWAWSEKKQQNHTNEKEEKKKKKKKIKHQRRQQRRRNFKRRGDKLHAHVMENLILSRQP